MQLPIDKYVQRDTAFVQKISENTNADKRDSDPARTTILLAEDNVEMQQYLQHVLAEYHVLIANNGEEALQLYRKHKDIKLVITDYMMPVMDGAELIENISQDPHAKPVIVLSALEHQEKINYLLSLGIYDYVLKPFHPVALKTRMANILNRQVAKEDFLETEYAEEPSIDQNHNISQIYEFVRAKCGESDFNVECIYEALHISKSTLYRKIKSETGLSPSEFIKEVKLLKARSIKDVDPSASIKYILHEIGWTNSTHFTIATKIALA